MYVDMMFEQCILDFLDGLLVILRKGAVGKEQQVGEIYLLALEGLICIMFQHTVVFPKFNLCMINYLSSSTNELSEKNSRWVSTGRVN